MRPLTPKTRAIAERLVRPPKNLWERWTTGRRRAGAIAALGTSGEAAAVLRLLPLLLDDRHARAASKALARLLHSLPVASLLTLEQTRVQIQLHPLTAWSRLSASDVPRLGQLPQGWAALAMASMHPDGRVRMAALQALVARTDIDKLPFLLLRFNDWVPEVQAAARAALEARLNHRHAHAWARVLPLVRALRPRRRVDHVPLFAAIERLLREPAALSALSSGSVSHDLAVRRACVRLALDAGTADPTLLSLGLCDDDRRLARAVAASLQRVPDGPEWHELVVRALRHSDPDVRRIALDGLAARPEARQRSIFEQLLLDPKADLRRLARDRLRDLDPRFDARAWYLERLARELPPWQLHAALQGLAETGAADDIRALDRFLAHERRRIRATAEAARSALAARRPGTT